MKSKKRKVEVSVRYYLTREGQERAICEGENARKDGFKDFMIEPTPEILKCCMINGDHLVLDLRDFHFSLLHGVSNKLNRIPATFEESLKIYYKYSGVKKKIEEEVAGSWIKKIITKFKECQIQSNYGP